MLRRCRLPARRRPTPEAERHRRASAVGDAARQDRHNGRHSERHGDTDGCLAGGWSTQPPQHPERHGRTDERSTSDVVLEQWRASPVAPSAERIAAAESDNRQHVDGPDDADGRSHSDAQRRGRARCPARSRCRFGVAQEATLCHSDAAASPIRANSTDSSGSMLGRWPALATPGGRRRLRVGAGCGTRRRRRCTCRTRRRSSRRCSSSSSAPG